jgi:protein SCO1/2
MKSPRVLAWLLLAAVGGLLAGGLAAHMLSQKDPMLQGGTWLPAPRGQPLSGLIDAQGHPFDAASAGQPALLFLGYSHCPDVCPATLATLEAALRAAPLPGVRVLFVSVDPERDTPAALRTWLDAFGPGITSLYAAPGQLDSLQRELGAAIGRAPPAGTGYAVEHSATLYLLDAHGRLAAVFTPPLSAATLASDLRSIGHSEAL